MEIPEPTRRRHIRHARRRARSSEMSRYAGKPMALLWRYIARRKVSHLIVLVSVLAAVGCALASQWGIKNLVDALPSGRTHPAVVMRAFVILVGLILADNLFWRVGGWIAARTFVTVTGDIRREMFAYLTAHPPAFFADKQPGVLSSRISATANAAYILENTASWTAIPPCLTVIGAIIMVGAVSVPMSAALVAVSGILAFGVYVLASRGTSRHHAFAARAAAVDGELVDIIGNMGLVRAFSAIGRERRRLDEQLGVETKARTGSLLYLEKLRLLHAIATAILSAGMLGWTLWLWSMDRATTGDVVLISSLGFAILHGTRDLAVAFVDLTQYVARLGEASAILLAPHAMPEHHDAPPLHVTTATIDFNNVTFAYPGRRPVLNGLNLQIRAGERVGLVGPSGAGKSTILALIQHFYEPASGTVSISGQDISKVGQDSLQAAISIVPQDVSLFHRTLLENIRYGVPKANEADVKRACEDANCMDILSALPDGLDTVVGDRGTKLSGGQRQRIAIARAILRDSPILLLDEATSSLDSASEAAIQLALERLMQNRTVVAIAHRLSTLQSFDRIVVVNRGRVVQDGSPSELANVPGIYRDTLTRQRKRSTPPPELA
ncbi:ABC transporter ATP-binding protein [Paraburkholderia phenazinium]|jgi:ATP-binding cassette subfamily B protein|uniref:ATP-binding cassette, subfamily B n=1 Tax=Paraburkholderia phenazinium TaxID=60549 RepID=A0A1N6KBC3_9BURK|nr:ABC transporter ATP-binding protein [Paraburkholderia phenazinium]SIO53617.1 ATP-binding cassette, subfamily B [Paraburkholderia phenazinium]